MMVERVRLKLVRMINCVTLHAYVVWLIVLGVRTMKNFIARYLPEEVIRILQTAYWAYRWFKILQQV